MGRARCGPLRGHRGIARRRRLRPFQRLKQGEREMAEKKTDNKLTTKQIAEALGTTPRELRVFLRASDDYNAVGSGSRYAFEPKDVGPMKTRFETWRKAC